MKYQGKIINWNDDKGFGFVEPNGGGDRAFVHVKSFKPRTRRPVNGEVIIYELVRESNNRFKAENIKFARDARNLSQRNKSSSGSSLGTVFTLLFCGGLLVSAFTGKLPLIIVGMYVVMSIVAFVAYAFDKSAAEKGRWRTQESTLHLFALMGGWPGAFFAQTKLRHKSSKKEFKSVFMVTVLINLGGFIFLHTEKGTSLLNSITSLTS